MKIKWTGLNYFFLSALLTLAVPALSSAQIELNSPQQMFLEESGFYPFSEMANAELKGLIQDNTKVLITITGFTGSAFQIAPAADFREIGSKKKVKGADSVLTLDFKRAKKDATLSELGLSFVPGSEPALFIMEVTPYAGGSCPNPVKNCDDDCGENLGRCCQKDAKGNIAKVCKKLSSTNCPCQK